MGQKELSPDAQYIMDKLYQLLNLMERHEEKYKFSRKRLTKDGLKHFISRLEEKLGVNR